MNITTIVTYHNYMAINNAVRPLSMKHLMYDAKYKIGNNTYLTHKVKNSLYREMYLIIGSTKAGSMSDRCYIDRHLNLIGTLIGDVTVENKVSMLVGGI